MDYCSDSSYETSPMQRLQLSTKLMGHTPDRAIELMGVNDNRMRGERNGAMSQLSTTKQVLLLLLTLGLWGFILYIGYFASPIELKFIGAKNIDKIAHLAGGVFLALLYEQHFSKRSLASLVIGLAFVTIGWEAFEYWFDVETRFFAELSPELWRLDSAGDIVAGLLGGYGWRVCGMARRTVRNKNSGRLLTSR